MIDLGKTNLLSSLLDSAGSENSEDGIRGLLHATTSHSGAQLSAKDVVDRIIAQTGDDVASAHSLADDPVVFEKLEEQVQRYIDDSSSADENEKVQALNALYSDISSLVQDSLNTEEVPNATIDGNPVSNSEGNISGTLETLQDSSQVSSNTGISEHVGVNSSELSAAESTSPRLGSSALRTGDSASQSEIESDVGRTSSAIGKGSGDSQGISRGRGFDVSFDLMPGKIVQVPDGVTKQEIQTEFTRLKNAVEKLNAIKISNAG